jgi:two-component system response regulator FlrC
VIGWLDLAGNGLVGAALQRGLHRATPLASCDEALAALRDPQLDALIIESVSLDATTRELLAAAQISGSPVLLIGRDTKVAAGVDALHAGASDYLVAPFEYESLQRAIERLLDRSSAGDVSLEVGFVTGDREVLSILELARSVAASDATVLIEGESGTGKELLARLVHRSSPRRLRDLISVNCAALPSGLLESELFGHERGAFTGAVIRSIGKFELAHGATILLDEIGELELALQAKLLRVLQEKEVQRIGAARPTPVDFRLVATTNRNLREEVKRGRFREDLFYRLNVLPIHLKPLRERRGDISLLVDHFMRQHASQGRALPVLSPAAMRALEHHAWPGNARELENLIERLVLVHPGRSVEPAQLGLDAPASAEPASTPSDKSADELPFRTIRQMERWLIVETLTRTSGNRTQAARELDISLRTLRNKIREYEINEPGTLPRTGLPRAVPVDRGAGA